MSDETDDLISALVKARIEHEKAEGPSGLALLAATLFPSQPVTRRQWFNRQTLHIDGHTFEDCRFDGCHLITESTTFIFRRCSISADSRIYFKGTALKTARLLMHTLRVQNRIQFLENESGLYATVHEDGTFTLE